MHNHSKVQVGDLSELERTVRSAAKKGGTRHHQHNQVHTARSTATSRSGTPRSTGASTYRSATGRALQGVEHAQQQRRGNENGLETSRGRGRPRPSTAGSVTSLYRHKQQRHTQQQPSGRRSLLSSRSSGSKDDGSSIGVPSNIKNEWLILETYQQLMADEKQAEEDRRAQSGAHADYEPRNIHTTQCYNL